MLCSNSFTILIYFNCENRPNASHRQRKCEVKKVMTFFACQVLFGLIMVKNSEISTKYQNWAKTVKMFKNNKKCTHFSLFFCRHSLGFIKNPNDNTAHTQKLRHCHSLVFSNILDFGYELGTMSFFLGFYCTANPEDSRKMHYNYETCIQSKTFFSVELYHINDKLN